MGSPGINFRWQNLLFFIFIWGSLAHGQKVNLNKGKAAAKHYYTEIEYQDLNGKLIIPVTIGGEKYRFLFDTGAPNLISHQLLAKIDFKSLDDLDVKDANLTSRPLHVIRIEALKIGEVDFKNSPFIVNNPKSEFLFNCLSLDGIIGSNLIRNSIVHIDSRQKKIVLTDESKLLPIQDQEYIDMGLSDNQSSPYIWIYLKGEGKVREQVLLDTGANGFYDIAERKIKEIQSHQVFYSIETAKGYKGISLFGLSSPMVHSRVVIPEISFKGASFKNVLSISSGSLNSSIGSDLLMYGRVTLDYRRKRFYFNAYDQEVDLKEKLWDISPTLDGSDLVVGLVWSEELAEKVSYGDRILSIGETEMKDYDVCNFLLKKSLWKDVDSLRIVLKDSSETRQEINLEKRAWD